MALAEGALDLVLAANRVAENLLGSRLIAAFGDDETALVMYDTETVLVRSAPGAECVTVRGGKIVRSRFVFDRLPFAEARART